MASIQYVRGWDSGYHALCFTRLFGALFRTPFFALTDSAVSARSRSARLTDSESGNTFANSGSISIRLVPAVASRWYLPRTPPFNCDRSYSGLKSSLFLFADAFFILLALPSSCFPRADESGAISPPRVKEEDYSLSCGMANRDFSKLFA